METRTVWQMVWDDYQKWLYKTLRGFGPFSLDRKKNSAIGLSKVVNSILAIIGTPWIIAHWVAFCNKNVRPQRTCNKVGYWIALMIALVLDLIPLSLLILFVHVNDEHNVEGLEKWMYILLFYIPLLYAGVSKLPYLFMNDPIIREEEHQLEGQLVIQKINFRGIIPVFGQDAAALVSQVLGQHQLAGSVRIQCVHRVSIQEKA